MILFVFSICNTKLRLKFFSFSVFQSIIFANYYFSKLYHPPIDLKLIRKIISKYILDMSLVIIMNSEHLSKNVLWLNSQQIYLYRV